MAETEERGEAEIVEVVDSFEAMNLSESVMKGIFTLGWERPSQIQKMGIVPIVQRHDVVGQAQSGTGKTATFAIAALQLLDVERLQCQVLILAPTRELAQQIQRVVVKLGAALPVRCHACVGGTAVRDDVARLKAGVHLVVGTPGRVYDMVQKNVLDTNALKLMVLDEADEMLNKGFKAQLFAIFQLVLSAETRLALFSATLPPDVLELTLTMMPEAKRILVKSTELTLEGIKQYYVLLETDGHKLETLSDLYQHMDAQQVIIYCSTRNRVETLSEHLAQRGHTVSHIHGELTQVQRSTVFEEFRSGATRILLATDLFARGIDVQQVGIVINYDMPSSRENYIHRIGRSGRYGRKGIAINLVTTKEKADLDELIAHYQTEMKPLPQDWKMT